MNKDYYLEKPTLADEKAFVDLITKWKQFGGRINPGLLKRYKGDYGQWLITLDNISKGIGIGEEVPQTLFFIKNEEGTIVGSVSLRHYLNHTNILDGGHVAYGICPEFRGHGLGTQALKLALKKLSEMNIFDVLITCDSDNIGSQKVILNNGGILENETFDEDGVPIHRYWIKIKR